jgi:hypothetical protein
MCLLSECGAWRGQQAQKMCLLGEIGAWRGQQAQKMCLLDEIGAWSGQQAQKMCLLDVAGVRTRHFLLKGVNKRSHPYENFIFYSTIYAG